MVIPKIVTSCVSPSHLFGESVKNLLRSRYLLALFMGQACLSRGNSSLKNGERFAFMGSTSWMARLSLKGAAGLVELVLIEDSNRPIATMKVCAMLNQVLKVWLMTRCHL